MRQNYLHATTLGIGELIAQRRVLRVPEHQRDYSWEKTNVVEYFEDIIAAYQDTQSVYFIGTLVITEPNTPEDKEIFSILDGQQRLVTTTIIYAAIRNWFYAHNFPQDAAYIQRTFLEFQGMGDNYSPRLLLNRANRRVYDDFIIKNELWDRVKRAQKEAGVRTSEYLLLDAYVTVSDSLENFLSQSSTNPKRLVEGLANYLEKNVQAVVLDVPKEESAFTIFEALNARGNELSTLDLVKNNLFSKAGNYLDRIRVCWENLSNRIELQNADDFLKVFWTSRYGRIRIDQLYAKIRLEISDSKKAYEFAKQLEIASEYYLALNDPRHEVWKSFDEVVTQRIQIIRELGSTQLRAPILAAIEKFDTKQMRVLLQVLITATVRYQIVGKRRTGDFEVTLARLASNIHKGKINKKFEIWNEIKRIIPDDDEFRKDFANYSERQAKRVVYFLLHLEQTLFNNYNANYDPFSGLLGFHDNPEIALPPIDFRTDFILPREPDKTWDRILQEDPGLVEDRVYYLGNRILIEEAIEFTESVSSREKALSNSEVLLTKNAFESKIWDRKSIERRQKLLTDLALKTWAVSDLGE